MQIRFKRNMPPSDHPGALWSSSPFDLPPTTEKDTKKTTRHWSECVGQRFLLAGCFAAPV